MEGTAAPAAALGPRDRWASLSWILGIAAVASTFALLPWHSECGFKVLLGAPCPGCGMTRACLALLRGDLAGTWRLHPLAVPLVLAFAAAVALALREGATGRPILRRLADRWAGRAAAIFIVAFAAVWAVRVVLHPAWSPDPLRPGSLAARILG